MALPAIIGTALAPLLTGLFRTIDKAVPDRDLADRLKGELQRQALDGGLEELKAAAGVIMAEAQGESWLQRSWRPILMLVIVAVVANNYLVAPYLEAIIGRSIVLPLPERLWDLMTLGVGGYIAGRTGEKIATVVKPSVAGK